MIGNLCQWLGMGTSTVGIVWPGPAPVLEREVTIGNKQGLGRDLLLSGISVGDWRGDGVHRTEALEA